MCNSCAERALKLRSVALDFRMTARLGPSEISAKLLKTAGELEAIAGNLLEAGHPSNECDVVWDDTTVEADPIEERQPLQCP